MQKTGRNDPCPCGSNKKYKQCCLPRKEAPPAGDHHSRARTAFIAAQVFQTALEHHQAGRLPQAEAGYRQVILMEPYHADALHLLGMIAYQSGNGEMAVELISRAIAVNPSNPVFHGDLGNVLQDQGKLDEAVAHYHRALSFRPDLAEVYSNLGKALHDQGKLDEAVVSYRKALSFKPDLVVALNNLGNALLDQGKPEEAAASYRRALSIDPSYAEAHYNLANTLLKQGKKEEAVTGYRRALTIRPDILHAHVNLGNALQDLGRPEEAVATYQAALALAPDLAQVCMSLGNVLREQGRWEEAISCYRHLTEIEPGNNVAIHILTALSGGYSSRAPREYVEYLFDGIANKFDAHLLDNLKYAVPVELVRVIRDLSPPPARKWDVLDLGCGTGLVGAAIAPFARRLVGVDLSSRMLAKAQERSLYHRLERSDLVYMMQGETAGSYDVVIAADVFIYIGDLDNVMREVKRLLRRDGLFGFSLEDLDISLDYKLMPTTRYAHSPAYIHKLAVKHGFQIHRMVSTQLRLEHESPVHGRLVLLGHDRPDH